MRASVRHTEASSAPVGRLRQPRTSATYLQPLIHGGSSSRLARTSHIADYYLRPAFVTGTPRPDPLSPTRLSLCTAKALQRSRSGSRESARIDGPANAARFETTCRRGRPCPSGRSDAPYCRTQGFSSSLVQTESATPASVIAFLDHADGVICAWVCVVVWSAPHLEDVLFDCPRVEAFITRSAGVCRLRSW